MLVLQPPVMGFDDPEESKGHGEQSVNSQGYDNSGSQLYVGIGVVVASMTSLAISIALMRILSTKGSMHWSIAANAQALL